MTNYEWIKAMTVEQFANFISELANHCDYEDGDYDPYVLKWLESERNDVNE